MFSIKEKIDYILKNKGLSRQKLSEIIGHSIGVVNTMANGKRPFSPKIKEKIIPILEISEYEFNGWIIADKYTEEVIEIAVKSKKEVEPEKTKTIFSMKLDEVLTEKELSRTALSKLIGYNQSGLNKVIIGQRTLSKKTLEKLSVALNISENNLLAWRIADNYSLEVLESALKTLNESEFKL